MRLLLAARGGGARRDPFGRYILQSELGRGGMGVVYRAWDTELRRAVALKTLLRVCRHVVPPSSDMATIMHTSRPPGKMGFAERVHIDCDTGSGPCGLTPIKRFVGAIAQAKAPRLGDCWVSAVSFYHEHEHLADLTPNDDWHPPSIFFQGMKFVLFAAPSIPLPPIR